MKNFEIIIKTDKLLVILMIKAIWIIYILNFNFFLINILYRTHLYLKKTMF